MRVLTLKFRQPQLRSYTRHISGNFLYAIAALSFRKKNTEDSHVAWGFVFGFAFFLLHAYEFRSVLFLTPILFLILTSIALFDARFFIIPNILTVALLVFGLISLAGKDEFLTADRLLAGLIGFLITHLISLVYFLVRGLRGLGAGDAKLIGAAGIWIGLTGLPTVFLFAALSALISILILHLQDEKITSSTAVPFGPHLALGIYLVWVVGPLTR